MEARVGERLEDECGACGAPGFGGPDHRPQSSPAGHLPVLMVTGTVGVWLFYVQHQFEDTYWNEHSDWSYFEAGLEGSSYLVLPKPLQWVTASIGIHHIHHLSARIPNYRLQQCLDENPTLQHVTRITIWDGIKTLRLALWDEDSRRLISFREARRLATTVP